MKKYRYYFFIGFIFLFFSVLMLWAYCRWMPVVKEKAGVTYYLRPGLTPKKWSLELKEKNLIQHPSIVTLYILFSPYQSLKTGEYHFPPGSTIASIWKQVTHGTGFFHRSFTLIPGWTFSQVQQALARLQYVRHESLKMSREEIMHALGAPEYSPEGAFFAETYYYTRDMSDMQILKTAFELMQSRLKTIYANRDQSLPFQTAYEVLIAASLVEKEAHEAQERPIIAGVLVNRLRHHMLLQFDPTVIYGLGSRYKGKIYKEDLKDKHPYNTYVHRGLPPTPIAIPSAASLEAVSHPATHDYFYFVALGNGQHQFSKDLVAHQHAVAAVKSIKPLIQEQVLVTAPCFELIVGLNRPSKDAFKDGLLQSNKKRFDQFDCFNALHKLSCSYILYQIEFNPELFLSAVSNH